MDTPGVMLPNVPNEQTGMRLALTGVAFISHALEQHCLVDYVGFADLCMCTCVCASLLSTEFELNISLAMTCAGVIAQNHAAFVSCVSLAWLSVHAGWNACRGLLCHMPAGAVKDSIVGEERLVRHLLLELAQQAPQSKGTTM